MKTADFRAEKQGKSLRLEIYDAIGPEWAGMIGARTVARAVRDAGEVETIDVRINSPGGSVFEGVAIHNMLRDHKATVNVAVDGVAASIASIVALAGDTIKIPKNALFMIHNPSAVAFGEQDDIQKTADLLGKVKSQLVDIYAERTKKSPEVIAKMMDDETWFTGQEAVEAGFADKTTADVKVTSAAVEREAYQFKRAPENFFSLVAMTGLVQQETETMPDAKTQEQLEVEAKAKADADKKAADDKAAADLKAKNDADAAVAADRQRGSDILAACVLAKRPQLAAEFIAKGTSLADVNAALVKVMAADNAPEDDGGSNADKGKDENSAYKAEYAKQAAAYAKAGMTEDDYVAQRRIDDGLDVLTTKAG